MSAFLRMIKSLFAIPKAEGVLTFQGDRFSSVWFKLKETVDKLDHLKRSSTDKSHNSNLLISNKA